MITVSESLGLKEKIIGFMWQHVLLIASLFVMTAGVALCVRSALGSSVISTIPFVMTEAGDAGMVPRWTIGQYTYMMNFVLVMIQILVLRRRFEPVQLFQLIIGFLFGWLLDINMSLTEWFTDTTLTEQITAQLAGCTVLGIGIAFEIRCGSVTMPGEGLPVALTRVTKLAFPKAKIYVDLSLVGIAVVLGYGFFGRWMLNVVGPGTLFAMIYVGLVVKFVSPRIRWFDHVVCYRPGFRRYVYGLARFIKTRINQRLRSPWSASIRRSCRHIAEAASMLP